MKCRHMPAILAALAAAACTATATGDGAGPAGLADPMDSKTMDAPTIMTWQDLLSRPAPQPDQTLSVGPEDTNIVDVWLPEGDGPYPTVLMIHGGC